MSSSQIQRQQQKRRFQVCRAKGGTGCYNPITFDKAFRGTKGGWVPLEEVTDSRKDTEAAQLLS